MQHPTLDSFSVRDLRTRSTELVRDAEAGGLSVITRRGQPAVLALPFNQRLLELGVQVDLAVALFEQKVLSLGKAAKLAGLRPDAFMDVLAQSGVAVVDYPATELTEELRVRL